MTIHNFRELIAWQKAMQLTKNVYLLLKDFPSSEQYGLISQIQRAVAYELETELLLAGELNYISAGQSEKINAEVVEVQKLVYSLMKKYNTSESN